MGYMSLKQQISHNLKRIRTASGISQQKLADRTGLQVRYLSQLENHPKDISTRTLEKLATGLGVSAGELVTGGAQEQLEFTLPKKVAAGLDEAIRVLKVHRMRVK
jgi:transcriptional regulator with XRE-family HTH domain